MVRSAKRVSNHEAPVAILRDGADAPPQDEDCGSGSARAWKGMRSHSRSVFSARVLPIRCSLLEQRAQGRPGADCARSTVCNGSGRTHTGLTGTAETSRPSPRNGFTAYFVLSPVSGLFCHRRCMGPTSSLTPGSRRQDHTTSPYAAAFSPGEQSPPDATSVHRNPHHAS